MFKNSLKITLIPLLIFLILFCVYADYISGDELLEKEAKLYFKKAVQLEKKGDIDKAIQFYQKSLLLDKSNISIYNRLGVLYEKKDLPKRAENMYLKAISKNPLYLPAHNNLAYLYEAQGEINKAVNHWRIRVALGDDNDEWVGIIRKKLSRYDTSTVRIKKSINTEKKESSSKHWLSKIEKANQHVFKGRVYFRQKNFKDALIEFKKAYELDPADKIETYIYKTEKMLEAKNYIRKGEKFYVNNNYEKAIYNFNQAEELLPENSVLTELAKRVKFELYFNRAKEFFKNKKYEESLDAINKAISLEPDNFLANNLKNKIKKILIVQ